MSHKLIVNDTLVLPLGMNVEHEDLHAFALTVHWFGPRTDTGRGGWGVYHGFRERQLSRAGNWGSPEPFQQRQYRWANRDEALDMACKHVDAVKVNGHTFAEWKAAACLHIFIDPIYNVCNRCGMLAADIQSVVG
jgi:hypothetical protein